MAECAVLLVDEIQPDEPIRRWVLSFFYPLRFLFASRPAVMSRVLGIVYRAIATHLIRKAGFTSDVPGQPSKIKQLRWMWSLTHLSIVPLLCYVSQGQSIG